MGDRSSTAGIIRSRRDLPPTHYSFKIQSYSQLLKTEVEKYETGHFEAGGYKWRLIFYANGDKKSDGENYISLYSAIEETKILPHGWGVNVDLKLFVFDQLRNNNGGVKRFHEKRTEWGFAQLLPLETFNDESNGYLVNDSCVFGAEAFVIQPTGRYESLSMVKKPDRATIVYKMPNFSKQEDDYYFSDPLTVAGRKWKIKVWPKGYGSAKGDWLSAYLNLSDASSLPPNGKVYAEFNLRVLDQRRDNHVETTVKHWFTSSESTWGSPKMVRLGSLHEASKGFVMNDTLIVEA